MNIYTFQDIIKDFWDIMAPWKLFGPSTNKAQGPYLDLCLNLFLKEIDLLEAKIHEIFDIRNMKICWKV
jgi:hypothetical protein